MFSQVGLPLTFCTSEAKLDRRLITKQKARLLFPRCPYRQGGRRSKPLWEPGAADRIHFFWCWSEGNLWVTAGRGPNMNIYFTTLPPEIVFLCKVLWPCFVWPTQCLWKLSIDSQTRMERMYTNSWMSVCFFLFEKCKEWQEFFGAKLWLLLRRVLCSPVSPSVHPWLHYMTYVP